VPSVATGTHHICHNTGVIKQPVSHLSCTDIGEMSEPYPTCKIWFDKIIFLTQETGSRVQREWVSESSTWPGRQEGAVTSVSQLHAQQQYGVNSRVWWRDEWIINGRWSAPPRLPTNIHLTLYTHHQSQFNPLRLSAVSLLVPRLTGNRTRAVLYVITDVHKYRVQNRRTTRCVRW